MLNYELVFWRSWFEKLQGFCLKLSYDPQKGIKFPKWLHFLSLSEAKVSKEKKMLSTQLHLRQLELMQMHAYMLLASFCFLLKEPFLSREDEDEDGDIFTLLRIRGGRAPARGSNMVETGDTGCHIRDSLRWGGERWRWWWEPWSGQRCFWTSELKHAWISLLIILASDSHESF